MNPQSARIIFLQALTLLLLALPFMAAGAYVWQQHLWAQAQLSELAPRHARLQGMRTMQPELQAAANQAQTTLSQHIYPATLDATKAGNDAQQRIRTVFEASQLTIGSLQVLNAKDSDTFQRINVVLQVEGTLPSMHEAILKLREQTPSILVDTLTLQSIGAVRPASTQRLSGNFNFSVLRARS